MIFQDQENHGGSQQNREGKEDKRDNPLVALAATSEETKDPVAPPMPFRGNNHFARPVRESRLQGLLKRNFGLGRAVPGAPDCGGHGTGLLVVPGRRHLLLAGGNANLASSGRRVGVTRFGYMKRMMRKFHLKRASSQFPLKRRAHFARPLRAPAPDQTAPPRIFAFPRSRFSSSRASSETSCRRISSFSAGSAVAI